MSPNLTPLLSATPPLLLTELELPPGLRVIVLAPHPDDFDAIGVSMRHLHRAGHEIHVAVLTSGANGVEDGWNGACGAEQKAAIRQAEQLASCRFFGLAPDRLEFLRMWERSDSSAESADYERLRAYLLSSKPHLAFLPHGELLKTLTRSCELAVCLSMARVINSFPAPNV